MKLFLFSSLMSLIASASQAADLNSLSFLAGCWRIQSGPFVQTENWTKPSQTLMLGVSHRRNSENKTTEYEFLRIQKQASGEVTYTPYINGRQSIDFTLDQVASLGDEHSGTIVFAHPTNSFPRKITYSRSLDQNEQIQVRLDGIKANGDAQTVQFPLLKVDCNSEH